MLASNVFANDENDKYFIAYNVSQTSKLSDILKKQMQSAVMLDQIAVETLKKIGQTQLAEQYYHRPDLQTKLRPLVQQFISSKSGSELFDEASTQLFSTIYSIEELKALYQNNKSVEGQKFINVSMGVDLSTQNYINNLYKQKFDKTSLDRLEADLDKIYTKYNFNKVSATPTTYSSTEQKVVKTDPNEQSAVIQTKVLSTSEVETPVIDSKKVEHSETSFTKDPENKVQLQQDGLEQKKAVSIDPTAQNTMNPTIISETSQNVAKTDVDQMNQPKAIAGSEQHNE